jgi:hypothetical protein
VPSKVHYGLLPYEEILGVDFTLSAGLFAGARTRPEFKANLEFILVLPPRQLCIAVPV